MGNPIFKRFGNRGNHVPGPFGNAQNLMNKFQLFASQFRGDPEAKVQELLNSGQMTQEQFNQFSDMAQPFQQMLQMFGRK